MQRLGRLTLSSDLQIQQDAESQLRDYKQQLDELQQRNELVRALPVRIRYRHRNANSVFCHAQLKQQSEQQRQQWEAKIRELEGKVSRHMEDLSQANSALQQEQRRAQAAEEKLRGLEEMVTTREDLLLQTFDREKQVQPDRGLPCLAPSLG